MRLCPIAILLLAAGPFAACSATPGPQAEQPAPVAASSAVPRADSPASAASATGTFEKIGIVASSDYAAVSLWPEQYAGAWTVLEVLPHGTLVQAGDPLATLDARAIDEELHQKELDLASSELAHRTLLEKGQLEDAAASLARAHSEAGLERAERALAGYKSLELAFVKRQDELQKRYEESNVEDQVDELDQLEKMYKDDALVDATEDIVIKRSRRQLELTRTSSQLSRDRSKYREEYELALGLAQREEALVAQREAHARLLVQQELDAAARADAELRSADGLGRARAKLEELRRDRALFELLAPRAGVLLHGGSKSFRAGGAAPRHEIGSQLAPRSEIFLVAAPAPGAVQLELGDAELGLLRSGARVQVQSLVQAGAGAAGELRIEAYPRSASASEASFEATVLLDTPLEGVAHGTRARVVLAGPQGDK